MPYCCESKVRMYWALSLPWSVERHEQLRMSFIYQQQTARRRAERFGYTDIQDVYCFSERETAMEDPSLPLAHVSIEVGLEDFDARKNIHAERAINLSSKLEGASVSFQPAHVRNFITLSTSAKIKTPDADEMQPNHECIHCDRYALEPEYHRILQSITRRRVLVSDGDPGQRQHRTDIRFGKDIAFDDVLTHAHYELSRWRGPARRNAVVHAEIYLLDYSAAIPVQLRDTQDEVIDKINHLKGNLMCLSGGVTEVNAFVGRRLSCSKVAAQGGTSRPFNVGL